MQKGIIGKKLGMTQLFDANGKVVPVTIIEAGPCTVVQKKTVESDGYQAVQMGYGEVSAKKVNKAAKGHFDKADVAPKRTLRDFRFDTGRDRVKMQWAISFYGRSVDSSNEEAV